MKKKTLSVLLSGLLAVSLTGVGFAAWLITGGAEGSASGNVSVETVEDRRIKLVANSASDDANVVLGHPYENDAPKSISGAWLKTSNSMLEEDLEATFNYKITNAKYATVTAEISESDTALQNLIDNNYITVDLDVEFDNTKTEETDLVLKVTFGWGSKFAIDGTNYNPYEYYNTKFSGDAVTEDVINDAINTMNTIAAVETFGITLTAAYNG